MADFLKMGQFLSSANLKKNNIHYSIADSDLWKQVLFHNYNEHTYPAYIYIIPSIVTYSNSYTSVNGDAYNSLLCLLEVWRWFSAQIQLKRFHS